MLNYGPQYKCSAKDVAYHTGSGWTLILSAAVGFVRLSDMTRSYERPPILEAICEIRFDKDISPAVREEVRVQLESEYPVHELGTFIEVEVKAEGSEQRTTTDTGVIKLSSLDGSDVVVLRAAALSICRMAPYEGWDAFLTTIKRVWKVYRKIAGYKKIIRVGLRYINRIDILSPAESTFEETDYINLSLNIPKDYKPLNSYELSFTASSESDVLYNVNSQPIPSPLVDHVGLMLDIDVYKMKNLPQKESGLLGLLSDFRQKKNNFFEDFITDKSRQLFDRVL